MLKVVGKYGNIHIEDKIINIDNLDIEDLKKYLKDLEVKQSQLINAQNEYLSQIIDEKESKDE